MTLSLCYLLCYLGDIVFGVNYEPLRDGSRTLVNALNKLTNTNPEDYHTHITHTSRETFPKTNVCLHLQCYRCFSTSDLLQFPTITHHLFASLPPIYLYSYELYSKKVRELYIYLLFVVNWLSEGVKAY